MQAADSQAPLVVALKTMIFSDIHRLLLPRLTPNLVGVLSLVGRGPVPLGTCRACLVSRIIS